jgi:HK97 family phage prohead protease
MGFWAGVRDVLVGRYDSDPVSISDSDQLPQLLRRMWGSAAMGGAVSREVALSVPAVARQHRLVASSIATLPLRELGARDDRVYDSQLLEQIDPEVPNVVTLAQTIEDLIFDSISWWFVTEFGPDGYPSAARRLAPGVVHLQPRRGNDRTAAPLPGGLDPRDQDVYYEGRPASADTIARLIRFDSPEPPLLISGARTIRRSILLDSLAEMYADNPRPLDYLSPAEGAETLADEGIVELLDTWAEYRRRRSTGYLPAALTYNSVDQPTPADLQLVPLQQRVSIDLANLLGIDPEDLGVSTTSRTYQNGTDRRQDRINDTMSAYMVAIAQRLSMRDVTQPGRRVEWDLDQFLRADPATRGAYFTAMHALGAITAAEINRRERLGPLPAAAPAAAVAAAPAGRDGAGFAADDDVVTLDFAAAPGAVVDLQRRTVRGRIVPYGEVAVKGGRRFRFLPGSLRWSDITRVKLLRDHDQAQARGVAFELDEAPDGQYGAFRVASGAEGDQLLALAVEGVYDGFSPGVEFDLRADATLVNGVWEVHRADLREVSLVAMPAFDNARVTSVTASRDLGGSTMPCSLCGTQHAEGVACPTAPPPAAAPAATEPLTQPVGATFTADQVAAMFTAAGMTPPGIPDGAVPPRQPINPARPGPAAQVNETLPYRFSVEGVGTAQRFHFAHGANGYDFSTDLIAVLNNGRDRAEAEERIGHLIRAQFDVDRADTAALSPTVHRPDMWVPQMDFATPLWDMINSGTTDGRSFDLPKFNSSSGLVAPAVEGVEPTPGAMTVTDQTITPSQVWGKVEVTRQAMRRGGNPQLSGILWEQMLREYYEDREAAVATFLNTLTAAADIALPAGTGTNQATVAAALEAALVSLQFVRGGNRFRAFVVHQDLFEDLAAAKDTAGRPLYPMINPANANGTTANLYTTMNIGGTTAVPAWALGAGGATTAQNSWLFDPAKVRGWASAPERLDWDFGATVQGISGATGNVPQLSHVTVGIYGDVALANLDIAGVRQVTYDPVA